MRRIALALVAVAMSLSGPSPALAQVTCSPEMHSILYWYDGPPPAGPLVGTEVFYCDDSRQMIGSYGTHDSYQYCGCDD